MASSEGYPRCGVTYVSQMEQEYMHFNKLTVCNNCLSLGLQKQLRRCNGCLLVDYCSRDCQKTNWTKHRSFCNMTQGKGKKNAYLSSFDRDTAFQIIIDTYRLRVELDHVHREEDHGIYYPGKWTEGIVWAKGDAHADFQQFLDLADTSGVLPEWWTFEDRMECLALAVDRKEPENIFNKIDESGLITRYEGDTSIRNALCILAELIVGYDGKGPSKDGEWFEEFQEYLDLHPDQRAKMLEGTVDQVKKTYDELGQEPPKPWQK